MTPPALYTTLVVRLPDLAQMPAFRVAGPSRRFDDATKAERPRAIWPRPSWRRPVLASSPFSPPPIRP